jgi:hypothetical protein
VGDATRPPGLVEVSQLLDKPDESVSLDLRALAPADRPALFEALLPRILSLRARSSRPHLLVIHEAHELVPPSFRIEELGALLIVTSRPETIHPAIFARVGLAIAIGPDPAATMAAVARRGAKPAPHAPDGAGDALVWRVGESEAERVRLA